MLFLAELKKVQFRTPLLQEMFSCTNINMFLCSLEILNLFMHSLMSFLNILFLESSIVCTFIEKKTAITITYRIRPSYKCQKFRKFLFMYLHWNIGHNYMNLNREKNSLKSNFRMVTFPAAYVRWVCLDDGTLLL